LTNSAEFSNAFFQNVLQHQTPNSFKPMATIYQAKRLKKMKAPCRWRSWHSTWQISLGENMRTYKVRCMDLERFQSQVQKAGAIVVYHSRRLIVRVANSVHYFWEGLKERFTSWRLPARMNANVVPNRRDLRPQPSHAFLTEALRPWIANKISNLL
jgi:hypothetical protein